VVVCVEKVTIERPEILDRKRKRRNNANWTNVPLWRCLLWGREYGIVYIEREPTLDERVLALLFGVELVCLTT